jgi:hypothetical protein
MRMMVADLLNGTTISGTYDLIGTENSGTGAFMYIAIEPFYGIPTTQVIRYSPYFAPIYYYIPFFKYPQNIKRVNAIGVSGDGTISYTARVVVDGTSLPPSYNIQFPNSTGIISYSGTSPNEMKMSYISVFGTSGTYATDHTVFLNGAYYNINYASEVRNACYLLPEQAGYNPYFTEDKIKHKLDNGKTLTYFKGFNFNADITFEQLNGTELDNLKTIKNLKSNLRFFPNIAEKPDLSYDVIWDSDFNYPFTTPTWTQGGYNGNIHFEGISRLGSIGDTI